MNLYQRQRRGVIALLATFLAVAGTTAHGGTLTATSVPGEGSTFRVELPPATTLE